MKFPDFYNTFLITIAIFTIIFYGMSMNFIVMKNNHGLMPVKTEYSSFDGFVSGTHVYYVNSSSVNNSRLTDIYYFAGSLWSLGDMFILFGFSAFATYSVVMAKRYHKWKKDLKNPYAYLCNECCCILEVPCFVDGKCPECNSSNKTPLMLSPTEIHTTHSPQSL